MLFAGYAAYAGWPWWWAAVAGGVCGFQVANARIFRGANKVRIEAGERAMAGKVLQFSLIGIAGGVAIATGVYYLVQPLVSG